MKNKHYKKRKKNKIIHDKFKNIIKNSNDQEKFDNLTDDESKILREVLKEIRLEELYEKLNIDFDKLNEVKTNLIKLPDSKWNLKSDCYINKKGYCKIEDLLNDYFKSIADYSESLGFGYGVKMMVEDIQNKLITEDEIKKMTFEESAKYVLELDD